ncbi:unnamed protein product [Symbiodinium sp. CCMP2592]|nr:unnamed protein product [Symbiodinium sp. CCMP2592]
MCFPRMLRATVGYLDAGKLVFADEIARRSSETLWTRRGECTPLGPGHGAGSKTRAYVGDRTDLADRVHLACAARRAARGAVPAGKLLRFYSQYWLYRSSHSYVYGAFPSMRKVWVVYVLYVRTEARAFAKIWPASRCP